jgi:glycosyltransferase involved in cell wall biosynthesis
MIVLEIIVLIINNKVFQSRFENRIVFIKHNHNSGAHFTINEGLMVAKGEYLTVINADDMYEPKRFEVMLEELKLGNGRIAFSKVNVIDENGININDSSEEARKFNNIQAQIFQYPTIGFALIPQNVAISTGNLLFEKNLFMEIGGFRSLKYCHDWDFILRCVLITEPIYVETTHYCYRLHENNTFRTLSNVADMEVAIVLGSFMIAIRNEKYTNKVAPSPRNFPNEFTIHIRKTFLSKFWNRAFIIKLYYYKLQQYLKGRFFKK